MQASFVNTCLAIWRTYHKEPDTSLDETGRATREWELTQATYIQLHWEKIICIAGHWMNQTVDIFMCKIPINSALHGGNTCF